MEDKRLVLRFDKARCIWRSLGTPAEAERAALAKELDKLAPLLAERSGVRCEQQPRTGSGRVYLFIRLPRQADRQP